MALRVPAIEVKHEAFAVRLGGVVHRILHVRRAEQLLPAATLTKFVRIVDRVTRLVPEDLHAPGFVSSLDFEHLRALEFFEPRVREIERDGDTGHAVWREPLRR